MNFLKCMLGLSLAPSAAILFTVAARTLWSLSGRSPVVYPFLSGIILPALLRVFLDLRGSRAGRAIMVLYVFGHELTHALATWMGGGKVFAFKAGSDGGHVDVSHVSAFASLAPYCVPLATVIVVVGYRVWTWVHPSAGGEPVFLFLMGLTLSFHLVATFECLWSQKQPDLDTAGGIVFSLALIVLANGLVFLVLLKVLFPKLVGLWPVVRQTAVETAAFWSWCGRGLEAAAASLRSR
ncbi:MAG: hypothetical protein HY927_10410 [Elusimicrobia bacterium]|nr:hypothetical protein [Elusimicrobiota bacterium]